MLFHRARGDEWFGFDSVTVLGDYVLLVPLRGPTHGHCGVAVRDGDGLSSRVGRDAVYWSLADARYPVVALDAHGDPEPLHRRATAGTSAPPSTPLERYARLLAALRAGHGTDAAAHSARPGSTGASKLSLRCL